MDPNILNSGAVRQLKTTKELLTTKLPLSSIYAAELLKQPQTVL